MSLRVSQRKRSRVLFISVLSVFLLGNNYCLVAAIAGMNGGHARLACHVAPSTSTAETARCCHPVRPTKHDPASNRAGTTYPCCMLVTAPSSLELGKATGSDHASAAVVLPCQAGPPSAISNRRAPEPRSDPPPEPTRVLLRSRAPPLS